MPAEDVKWMRLALREARKGVGFTTPNPCVGAVLVRKGELLGKGWHRRAGEPHAEIETLRDTTARGLSARGATLYVTLEPCCTHGRTPPCTEAIIAAGVKRVVVAATDPNPAHAGRGFELLASAGVKIETGVLAEAATELNAAFNHWIVHRTPFITLKSAMSLDGRIATESGQSKWITGPQARAESMKLRRAADAILVGVGTILADNPSLTWRPTKPTGRHVLTRIILDPRGRTPLDSKILDTTELAPMLLVLTEAAPAKRAKALARRCEIWNAGHKVVLASLMAELGRRGLLNLLVEGGGETIGRFLDEGLGHRWVGFYAPMVIGGELAPRGVSGHGVENIEAAPRLSQARWKRLGEDFMLTGAITRSSESQPTPKLLANPPS